MAAKAAKRKADARKKAAKTGTYTFAVRIENDLHEAVEARAVAEERTMSHLVRWALRKYLDRPPMIATAWVVAPLQLGRKVQRREGMDPSHLGIYATRAEAEVHQKKLALEGMNSDIYALYPPHDTLWDEGEE